ncbi:MAG: hypothetical protein NTU73_00430, partial [Ignavibacteriae bacterium]|nr:hypothetical protein [Ignavibacteriota bacterium]
WCETSETAEYFKKENLDYICAEAEEKSIKEINEKDTLDFITNNGFYNLRFFYYTQAIAENSLQKDKYWINKSLKRGEVVKKVLKESGIEKVKICFTFPADELSHNTFKLFANAIGANILYYTIPCFFDRIAFTTNPKGVWHSEINTSGSDEIKKYISEFLNTTLNEKAIVSINSPSSYDVNLKASRIKKIVPYFFKLLSGKDIDIKKHFNQRKFEAKRIARTISANKYYKKLSDLKNEKYFYFPLHFPEDSQLTVRGKPFISQEFIVEVVARYIPYPYKLVVKEHPHCRGYYDLKMLKKIRNLNNVILLPPLTNSHFIIPKASAVVVINSTVGFEALLYKKPVVTLEDSFYRGLGITLDVKQLSDLEYIIPNALNWKVTDEMLKNFLLSLYNSSYDVNSVEIFKSGDIKVDKFINSLLDYIRKNKLM